MDNLWKFVLHNLVAYLTWGDGEPFVHLGVMCLDEREVALGDGVAVEVDLGGERTGDGGHK